VSHTWSPSQSPLPASQLVLPHSPSRQYGSPWLAEHFLPQPPQLSTSLSDVSQPLSASSSQSPKSSSQSMVQAELTHQGLPCRSGHTIPQPPQFMTSVLALISQPSPSSALQRSHGFAQESI